MGHSFIKNQWNKLKHLENILPHPDNIFINSQSIFVLSAANQLYFAGNNLNSQSGIGNKRNNITAFTKVLIIIKRLSTEDFNRYHTMIHKQTEQQLTANGYNELNNLVNMNMDIECIWTKSIDIRITSRYVLLDAFYLNQIDLYQMKMYLFSLILSQNEYPRKS